MRPRSKSGAVLVAAAVALAAAAASGVVLAAGNPADWPMYHHDAGHSGVAADTSLGAAAAPKLVPLWLNNTGAAAYTSPAVVHDSVLGKTVIYVGNQVGTLSAYDAVSGERLWATDLPEALQSSPAVVDGVVYIGSSDHYLYAFNARTGAQLCRFNTGGTVSASPLVVDPDGNGLVVYAGDTALSGNDGGHIWGINAVDPNAAANCSRRWVFSGFDDPKAGSWSPPAFARDANSRPLVVVGSSSPDNAVYALDARTGQRVWRFQTQEYAVDNDVGDGPTISAPGVNGFAHGVVYVSGKDRIAYALDLTTGAKIWQFRMRDDSPTTHSGGRSTAALVGNRIYLGDALGMYALNATTGAKLWKSQDVGPATQEILSAPAVSGAAGDQAVFAGDLSGKVLGFSAANGTRRFTHQTGALIYGSPAVADGRLYITSSDGFLYAFGVNSSGNAPPTTTITTPAAGASIPHPVGSLALVGTASDDTGVARVRVAVLRDSGNAWWNAVTGKWQQIFTTADATLSAPGATNTGWHSNFTPPSSGGAFTVQAEAIDAAGRRASVLSIVRFAVSPAGNPPDTTITSPAGHSVYHFPSGVRQSFVIPISGTAVDSGGAHPGIAEVRVSIKNVEHSEYYCGPGGCAGDPTHLWSTKFASVPAKLASPGAVSTGWTSSFPTYDHPHNYAINAWAIDRDGERDPINANAHPICVRDPGSGCYS
jgi:outer membrane protein assembly factor BamB